MPRVGEVTSARTRSWWREGVFYQIYPRSFQDSNGDGIGDLPGITARLDHLNGREDSLGIDAIWLSPFYRSPMADFGYDVSDYRDVDPTFGTLADFDRLLSEAHRRGIRVIVDLVPNHTSDQHPWFSEARASRANAKRDWYVWADPNRRGGPPNNWIAIFGERRSAWTLDPATGQYYMHHFLPEQPDLNWWNEDVRRAIDDVMRFWLDRGVDGFRVDVAHGLVKDELLRNNPRLFARRRRKRNWDLDEVHEIHRRWRRVLDEYPDRMAVGEVTTDSLARLVNYYGQDDELHMPFNFHFLGQPWDPDRFREVVERWERLLPAHAWPDYTLSNHDRPRAASRYGIQRARVAAMMLLTLRGTPFIYYGEEIGMADVPIPRDRVVDVAGRDPERTPMQWDASPNAGFTTGEPWLPIAADAVAVNVERQRNDPGSLFSFYRQLLQVRRESPALRRGSYRSLRGATGTYVFERAAEHEQVLVALNFTDASRRIALPVDATDLVLSTEPGREGHTGQELSIEPNEGVILRARSY
ncbi:MAG TPA: alpha-amylase family glycosyl hydrolase [Candidatus Limnocylindria bacterium]